MWNRQTICTAILPSGAYATPDDGVVTRCVVIRFAWLVVLVLVWEMLDIVMSGAAASGEVRSCWIMCVGLRVERSVELDYERRDLDREMLCHERVGRFVFSVLTLERCCERFRLHLSSTSAPSLNRPQPRRIPLATLKSLLQQKLELGEDDGALAILKHLIAAQPDVVDWKFLVMHLVVEMGNIGGACAYYEEGKGDDYPTAGGGAARGRGGQEEERGEGHEAHHCTYHRCGKPLRDSTEAMALKIPLRRCNDGATAVWQWCRRNWTTRNSWILEEEEEGTTLLQ
ncbi:hypothetical protein DEO72_LG6g2023 [Vigna unguiculata]|uniref:Tetratricopeptide repeat n=1 Tax=Vigna unguiculata TaxID=3917 RepID=A0A4D6M918_VIGUN|nr:hypothetical protein DEO72_LG6g2023 [Vigna unguiculata]